MSQNLNQATIVIPDLFLPQAVVNGVCADLHIPSIVKFLSYGNLQSIPVYSLEEWVCQAFSVPDLAIAPVTLKDDGLSPENAFWMRADPVHLHLNHTQMVLQTNVSLTKEESEQLCFLLNQYYSAMGLKFFAPNLQRWYVQLNEDPQLKTHPVSQVEGRDSRHYMPQGLAALKWHGVMNEIQMLLYGHPISQACEARGGLPVNSVWLWGGGRSEILARPFTQVSSDSELIKAFSNVSGTPHTAFYDQSTIDCDLLVWESASAAFRKGDFYSWRQSIIKFDQYFLLPILKSLASGRIDKLTLVALQDTSSTKIELTRSMLWKFWKRPRILASFALE